jgi:DNA recombination protein RmuC
VVESRGDAERRRQAIESLIKPINALLEKQNSAVAEIEKKREVAYRGLEEQIKAIAASHEKLGTETSRLVAALRRPEQRGRWGEMQLHNAVELAGMTAHCDFTLQPQTDDPTTRDRPDMIVHIPGGGRIIVDAKVALDAYLEALEPGTDHAALVQRHASQVVEHYRHLASKQYWSQFERTPKLVVMFMPLESAMTAALEVKPDLHAEAMKHDVLIATPTLLVAMLRAIAYGWQQDDVAANARQIARVGDELYKRLSLFAKRFTRIGAGIDDAREAYNAAVGTLENRVLASTRELKRLHATTEPEIETPRRLEVETRPITAAELKPPAGEKALTKQEGAE